MTAVDLAYSLLVSRNNAHGGPTDLELNDWPASPSTGRFAVARGGAARGGVIRRNFTIDGEGTEGDELIHTSRASVPVVWRIYVFGTPSQRETRRALLANDDLTGALDQFSYTFTETVRGVVRKYRGRPADVIPGDGGALDEFLEISDKELLTISFTRRPTALEGSF